MKPNDRYLAIYKIGVAFQIDRSRNITYFGIEPLVSGTKEQKQEMLRDVVDSFGGFRNGVNWCYLKNISYEEAFDSIQDLVAELNSRGWI